MYAVIDDTNRIHPNDNAVSIVGFLQRARDASDGTPGACPGDERIDFHGRWSRRRRRGRCDCINDLWSSRVFVGQWVVCLCTVRPWSPRSCDTHVAVLIKNDGMRSFALELLGHTCGRRGIQPREMRDMMEVVPIWLSGESQGSPSGVRMTLAPSARRTASFSCDILLGMDMMTGYPLSAVFSKHSSRR